MALLVVGQRLTDGAGVRRGCLPGRFLLLALPLVVDEEGGDDGGEHADDDQHHQQPDRDGAGIVAPAAGGGAHVASASRSAGPAAWADEMFPHRPTVAQEGRTSRSRDVEQIRGRSHHLLRRVAR